MEYARGDSDISLPSACSAVDALGWHLELIFARAEHQEGTLERN